MGDDAKPESAEQGIRTPEQILKQAILDTKRLDEESQEALTRGDSEATQAKLRERAMIVAGLPDRVQQAQVQTGRNFPDGAIEELRSFQYVAQKALDRNGAYVLGLVLFDVDSRGNKLNILEQLVNQLYPKNSPEQS
jgi:hypothetical protein